MTRKIKYIISNDQRSAAFNDFILKNFGHFSTEETPDLILVTGGDGAMLHAIQSHFHHQVPFIGHAAGTLNYLMNNIDNYDEAVSTFLDSSKQLHIVETTSIKVDVVTDGTNIDTLGYAVNEVVFGQDVMGYHSFNISSEDGSFDDFNIKGTGISISTDLGSTGYNFNLGGSVLPLGSNLWSVVGVVCNRYLNDILHIQNISVSPATDRHSDFSVFLDGIKKQRTLGHNQKVILSRGPTIKIAFINKTDFIRKRVDITSRYRKA